MGVKVSSARVDFVPRMDTSEAVTESMVIDHFAL